MYFLFLIPGLLLGMYAQWKIRSAYGHASQVPARSGVSGAETADAILRVADVRGVAIEDVPGQLTDHYSPAEKTLRLSPEVFEGRSLASLGIAAHEVGHAIQDARRYPLLVVRNFIVPMANFGSSLGIILMVVGFALSTGGLSWLVYAGIGLFSLTVLFQLVNLPVEFDASRRARQLLRSTGLVAQDEEREVARVLNAAALTYVAATLTSILTLAYFLMRAGAFGRRD
jgi:Zn-dependent membrane protease YugP